MHLNECVVTFFAYYSIFKLIFYFSRLLLVGLQRICASDLLLFACGAPVLGRHFASEFRAALRLMLPPFCNHIGVSIS